MEQVEANLNGLFRQCCFRQLLNELNEGAFISVSGSAIQVSTILLLKLLYLTFKRFLVLNDLRLCPLVETYIANVNSWHSTFKRFLVLKDLRLCPLLEACIGNVNSLSCIPDKVFRDFHRGRQTWSYIPLSDPWGRQKRITARVVYRRSSDSFVQTLGVDIIATLHNTSAFNMASTLLVNGDSYVKIKRWSSNGM